MEWSEEQNREIDPYPYGKDGKYVSICNSIRGYPKYHVLLDRVWKIREWKEEITNNSRMREYQRKVIKREFGV